MRWEVVEFENGSVIHVTLSRRNLLGLLAKLDIPGSAKTLIKDSTKGRLIVTSEEDPDHYMGREPGPMSPETEKAIRK